MCRIALVGATGDIAELRTILTGQHGEFDADQVINERALAFFHAKDEVIRVTHGGCSCPLLQALGRTGASRAPAGPHVAGPGYQFRLALANATLRFGSIRLLVARAGADWSESVDARRRVSLVQFLRFGLAESDRLLSIVAS